jgi:hypothetical protein
MLGYLAVAGLMMLAAPVERAQAVSLINPASAMQTKYLSDDLVLEVRHRGGFRGGFRGGGHRIGRMHFGGHRHFGHRHFGHRHFGHRHFRHRHVHFHRRHYWHPRPYIYYAQPRIFCRWIYTDFGPRRICRHRPWWV